MFVPAKVCALSTGQHLGLSVCFFCLCWGLTSQSTIFQSCRDGATASWVINQYFRGVKCLAQGHNTAEVGFEPPTSRSGVQHSTTEPPRSPFKCVSRLTDSQYERTVDPHKSKQANCNNWCTLYYLPNLACVQCAVNKSNIYIFVSPESNNKICISILMNFGQTAGSYLPLLYTCQVFTV